PALRDTAHRAGELRHVGDPVLQQVADTFGALRQEVERVLRLDVLREHEHARLWVLLADLARGAQALVGVRRRHADVDDRDLGAVGTHLEEELLRVARLADHLEARVLEQTRDALAEKHGVFGEHDAHRYDSKGISATTLVPPASGLSIDRRPSSTATRSASPRRPEPPAGSAPPMPSSATWTRTRPFGAHPATSIGEARACLTTFAIASETT